MSSNVTLEIAGRQYTVSCAPGEEEQIKQLGASINGKLGKLGNIAGQSPDRVLLYASLLLADELHEAQGGSPAADLPPAKPARTDPALGNAYAEMLEKTADRLEALAQRLESEVASA